ncbi:MAG: DNA polymerase III subunit alpha [Bacteroidetes bacterium]|nr:DNA polymerase III subunit alpha [Bacteroidota bacterium]
MFLNAHSWFSFKYGILSPEALLEEAAKAGVRTLALTDIHNTAGIPDFVRLAGKYGIRPVAGIEFRQGTKLLYIGLAKNNNGYQQLNELLSPHLLDGEPLPRPEHKRSGTPQGAGHPRSRRTAAASEAFFILPFTTPPRTLHPNERIGIRPCELTRLPFSPWAKRLNELVALLPVTFRSKQDFNTHRLLRTMAANTLISLLPAEELANPDETCRSEAEVRRLYRDFPELLRNTEALLEQCSIGFDGSDKTRKVFGESIAHDREHLHRLALEGVHRRYSRPSPAVISRMQHELDVIERMGFISYFLINHDIVRYARHRGFFHVGRGSGANSLVAYCLGITDVDPIELNLYFERFISTARKKPPDFDIDFSWKDRDEVYRYVFAKYNGGPVLRRAQDSGERVEDSVSGIHAAQVATYTTFQWRGAVRELGKAVGLPPEEIDALSEGRSRYGGGRPSERANDRELDRVAQAVVRYAKRLIGMPHQFGIHVGGIVITDKPVTHHGALFRPPKGFPVVQLSLLECEDLGLHKFDLLSQRGLGHIRDAVELVNASVRVQECKGARVQEALPPSHPLSLAPSSPIDIHDIPHFKQDPAIKQLLRTGDTVGCFYVESPAMRMLLKKLRVEDYLTLVAASSIIRPGVAESGMMREYILRHNDPERVKRAPKELLEIMPDTYGVMVYQEDVLKVAHLYAGLSLEEADLLRRGMTARFRERPEFKAVQEKFFANCKAKGHPPGQAEEVWRQIESFASFSFAKGHSASYAVESYQSLWLKAHHPLEFMVAVANNFGGFYSLEFYLHEARRHGAVIEAPCVNWSDELCLLVQGCKGARVKECGCPALALFHPRTLAPRIYLGLANIKSLTAEAVQLILHERRRNGPFRDLEDLLHRVPLPLEQARILIRTGALRFTGKNKPQLLWDLTLLHNPAAVTSDGDLFITKVEEPLLPALHHYPLADAYDELELLGFPLCDPFSLVEGEELARRREGAKDEGLPPRRQARQEMPHAKPRRREDAKVGPVDSCQLSVVRAASDDPRRTTDNRQRATNNYERRTANYPPTILKRDMPHHIGKRVIMLGYMVHIKPASTRTGEWMSFGSFIDTAGELWDSTQFPVVAARYPFRGRGVYRLTGVVEEEFGHHSLRTQQLEKLSWKADPRYGEK